VEAQFFIGKENGGALGKKKKTVRATRALEEERRIRRPATNQLLTVGGEGGEVTNQKKQRGEREKSGRPPSTRV